MLAFYLHFSALAACVLFSLTLLHKSGALAFSLTRFPHIACDYCCNVSASVAHEKSLKTTTRANFPGEIKMASFCLFFNFNFVVSHLWPPKTFEFSLRHFTYSLSTGGEVVYDFSA